jgi:hypothetical protein
VAKHLDQLEAIQGLPINNNDVHDREGIDDDLIIGQFGGQGPLLLAEEQGESGGEEEEVEAGVPQKDIPDLTVTDSVTEEEPTKHKRRPHEVDLSGEGDMLGDPDDEGRFAEWEEGDDPNEDDIGFDNISAQAGIAARR